MPDFELVDSKRFPRDFVLRVVTPYKPTELEALYLDRVARMTGKVAELSAEDDAAKREPSVLKDLVEIRDDLVTQLREDAEEFVAANKGQGQERDQLSDRQRQHVSFFDGAYRERRSTILKRPFDVQSIPPGSGGGPHRPMVDINIITRDVFIPEDKQKFKVALEKTTTVIKVVLSERRSAVRSILNRIRAVFKKQPLHDPFLDAAKGRLDEYLFAVYSIAQVGLMNIHESQTKFADLALAGLQEEFRAREAGQVKNSYIVRLGGWALCASVICTAAFFLSGQLDNASVPYRFRRFFLLATGAAVGTWLSFSLRRAILTFEDLAALEEDRLSPGIRIIFVLMLTSVVGLLLWTKATTIEIGNFSSDFRANGAYAALIGALCGIAERGLATAVTKRAGDFAASIGGKS